jgi:outer membrane lipoprotein-sorting protein
MKHSLLLSIIAFLSIIVSAQNYTAKEIIKLADDKNRGLSSKGEMTMTIVRTDWTRSVKMKSWSKGNDFAMVLITAPPKEKGQVFLKRRSEMWNWVPSIDRMVKIPPSMMLQSWMGSDFTNDDLVQQSSIVKDYTHKLLGKENIRGLECYKIELIPLPDATIVWGKIITWITTSGFDMWKSEYFDEDMLLINIENAYDIKNNGDRLIPTRMEIEPVTKKGQKTILTINNMLFNIPIEESFFSQQNMKKIR